MNLDALPPAPDEPTGGSAPDENKDEPKKSRVAIFSDCRQDTSLTLTRSRRGEDSCTAFPPASATMNRFPGFRAALKAISCRLAIKERP